MKYFNIEPPEGWGEFSRNSELADFIYDTCFDKVNENNWFYMNPVSNTGIFEDDEGNYLGLDLVDIKENNIISHMDIGLNENTESGMAIFIKKLETDFNLIRKGESAEKNR